MKRFITVVMALAICVAALSAVPLTATWIEGNVERLNNSSWVPLNVGDTIASASKVRLRPGASAEFTGRGHKIAITAPGVFELDTLLKLAIASAKPRTSMLDTLGKLINPKVQAADATSAGVRGAAVGDQTATSVTWESDETDTDTLLADGRQLARDGRFAEAAEKFRIAASLENGEKKDEALYSQAWALAAGQSFVEAIRILRTMRETSDWSAPRTLLLARLDIDSGARDEAVSILQAALNVGAFSGNDIQMAKDMLAEAR